MQEKPLIPAIPTPFPDETAWSFSHPSHQAEWAYP